MKMNNSTKYLVLWTIFGFVLISATSSILDLTSELLFIGQSLIGIPATALKFTIPLSTLFIYIATGTYLIRKADKNFTIEKLSQITVPKQTILILTAIAIGVPHFSNYLLGQYGMYIQESPEYRAQDFYELYGIKNAGTYISKWVTILFIILSYYRKIKTEHNIR